jgi:hypothetical protein
VLLAGACLTLPIACSDDDTVPPLSEAGSGGESGSGGGKGSGGASTGGKVGSGGAGGGASGGASSGGASSGGASSGGASSGGNANTGGSAEVDDGGTDGGDGGVGCSGPLDPNKANICITFLPEAVTSAVPADVQLNNIGTLVVQVFPTAFPASAAAAIATNVYPAPPNPATSQFSEQVAVTQLPKIGFGNLPDTVYVRAFFVDNPTWFATQTGLRYGMQVGGMNLNNGLRPANNPQAGEPPGVPPLRAVTLTKGEETALDLRMFALKKFTTTVMKFPGRADPPAAPIVPADDGQGPLSVGVFTQRAAAGAQLFGGVEAGCVNVNAAPVTVSGFFFNATTIPTAGTTLWFSAQVNDFNTTPATPGGIPAGSLISIVLEGDPPAQVIPPTQHALVMPGQYSAVLDSIPTSPTTTAPSPVFLTAIAPGLPTPNPPSYQCPVVQPVDAGGD